MVAAKAGENGLYFSCKLRVAQLFGGLEGICEAFAGNGYVRRGSVQRAAHVAVRGAVEVFRRGGGGGNEFPVLFHQVGHAELRGALQDGVVPLKCLPVPRIEPVLPDMGAEPGSAHVPVGPARVSAAKAHGAAHGPEVAVMGQAPAFLYAVIIAGGDLSGLGNVVQETQQGFVHFRQGGGLRGPVILLQVDVHRVIAAPRRVGAFVPQALKVGRNAMGAGAGDKEVSAILEIKGLQLRVGLPFRVAQKLLVRGEGFHLGLRAAKIHAHAAKKGLVVLQMAFFQLLPAGVSCLLGVP